MSSEALLPCSLCGEELLHIEGVHDRWAHPWNDCLLSAKQGSMSDWNRRATPSPASGELASLVERLSKGADSASWTEALDLLRLAASQLAAVAAERDALRHDVESSGSLRLRMEAHRQTAVAARENFLTMQGAAAVLLKRAQKADTHLADIIRAYDANSGNEPSVSVLARAIDEARSTLSPGGSNGQG